MSIELTMNVQSLRSIMGDTFDYDAFSQGRKDCYKFAMKSSYDEFAAKLEEAKKYIENESYHRAAPGPSYWLGCLCQFGDSAVWPEKEVQGEKEPFVRWSYWPKVGPVESGYMSRSKMQGNLQRLEVEARKLLAETGADHVLYGRKLYNEAGELDELRFYLLPMSDEEFEERVVPLKNQRVYALHKMK